MEMEPYSRDELIAAFAQQEAESVAYWNGFDLDAFFRRIGTSWSPAETVRHLIKSTRAVTKAFAIPSIALLIMFGRAKRPSMTYEQFRARYVEALAAGGRAGRFGPSDRIEQDLQSWRASIMRDYAGILANLRKAIARWPDRKLDRFQLPHPLLGKLTLREMVIFTLYHQRHHIGVVERRLAEAKENR